MLLDGEGTRIERPSVTERVELLPWEDAGKAVAEGEGNELGGNASNKDRRV